MADTWAELMPIASCAVLTCTSRFREPACAYAAFHSVTASVRSAATAWKFAAPASASAVRASVIAALTSLSSVSHSARIACSVVSICADSVAMSP